MSFAADANDTTSSITSIAEENHLIQMELENTCNEVIYDSEDKSNVKTKSLSKLSVESKVLKAENESSTVTSNETNEVKTNIIYVNPKADVLNQEGTIKKPYAEIGFAVQNCLKDYDNIIYLSAGTYELPSPILVNGNITIIGKSKYKTIIDCFNHQGFRMAKCSSLTLEKLLIKNAEYSQGGAIIANKDCNLMINNCYFKLNQANNGAVLFGSSGNIKCNITNSIFQSNKAVRFGAALQLGGYNSVYNVKNCTFSYNVLNDTNYTRSNGGAAIYACTFATVNVDNCTFKNNKALWGNAILNGNHATLTVNNSIFTNNAAIIKTATSRTKGGAIAIGSGDAVIINCSFTKNKADIGGAISVNSGENVLIDSCSFIENCAYYQAGAINNYGTLNIKNSTFLRNDGSQRGGAILNIGNTEISIDNCIFKDNKVKTSRDKLNSLFNRGGAINILGLCYSFTIKNTLFDHNVAFIGGAIYSNIDLQLITIKNSTFFNNSAYYGGAMSLDGETILISTDNKFEFNRALRKGGSIYINNSVQGTFKNTEFNNNTASTINDGDGGALYIADYARLAFNYCSFRNNYANLKGGAICSMSAVTINIFGTNITNNNATKGSGIYLDNSKNYGSLLTKINIETSTFIGNLGKYVFYSVKKYDEVYNDIKIFTSWWGKNVMTSNSIYNFYQKNHFLLTLSLNGDVMNINWTKNNVECTINRTATLNKDLILTFTYIIEDGNLRYTDTFLPIRCFYIRENGVKVLTKSLYVYYHLDLSLDKILVRMDNQLITINIVS